MRLETHEEASVKMLPTYVRSHSRGSGTVSAGQGASGSSTKRHLSPGSSRENLGPS